MKMKLRGKTWGIQRTIIGVRIRLVGESSSFEERAPACTSCKTEHKRQIRDGITKETRKQASWTLLVM